MSLIQIADAIDAQIVRLQKVRTILITLLPVEVPVAELLTTAPELEVEPRFEKKSVSVKVDDATTPLSKPKLREAVQQRPGLRRPVTNSHARARQLTATALSGAVPQGPVVVSAADVVRSKPVTETPAPGQNGSATSKPGHSLDDLIRQLSQRSIPGLPDRPASDSSR